MDILLRRGNRLLMIYFIEARQGTLEELAECLTEKEWFDSCTIK